MDILMKQINSKPTANGANITDARERVLKAILDWYSINRRPALLEDRLLRLVDGEGLGVEGDFTTHRNVLSSLFSKEPPKKSVVVRELLRTYPR